MNHIERIDDCIKTRGYVTHFDAIYNLNIGNFNARMSEARKIYPIKRVEVQRTVPNRYGEKPRHYIYYYDRKRVRLKKSEKVVKWLDEE